jgi:diguanylate cyclase (GGDEF)-like protein
MTEHQSSRDSSEAIPRRYTLLSSVRARLLLLVLLAIIPPIGLVLYNAFDSRKVALDEARQDVMAFARLAAEQLAGEIYAASYMQGAIAQIPAIRQGVEPACSDTLTDLLKRTQRYTGLAIARPDGTVFCSGQRRIGFVTYSDREYFQKMLHSRAPAVGKPVVGKISGRAQVPLAYPLLNAKGEVDRVVVTGVDLARFAEQFAKHRQLPKAAFMIWDEARTVFYRYPDNDKWFGHKVPAALRSSASGETTFISGMDGIARVYGTAALSTYPDVGISISVGASEAELVQLANSTLKRSLLLLGLVAGLAFIGALLLSELYIRRPVVGLVASARRVGAGDLDSPIPAPLNGGELGVLARALESMRHEVRKRELELREAAVRYQTLLERERELKVAKDKAEVLATHDFLTGLPNRVLLLDRITQALARARRQHRIVALLSLDIDDFKKVNDTYGHGAGDRLLVELAARTKASMRESDTLTRLGGDEFLLLAPEIDSIAQVESMAAHILERIGHPFQLGEVTTSITFSVGIALYPRDGATPEVLIAASDRALYLAKKLGKNRFALANQGKKP